MSFTGETVKHFYRFVTGSPAKNSPLQSTQWRRRVSANDDTRAGNRRGNTLRWRLGLGRVAYVLQSLATVWTLGCANSHPMASGSQDAGFTQPRDHLIAHLCTICQTYLSNMFAESHLAAGESFMQHLCKKSPLQREAYPRFRDSASGGRGESRNLGKVFLPYYDWGPFNSHSKSSALIDFALIFFLQKNEHSFLGTVKQPNLWIDFENVNWFWGWKCNLWIHFCS